LPAASSPRSRYAPVTPHHRLSTQREGGPDLATQLNPLQENLASFLSSVSLPEPMRPPGVHRRKTEKRFKDKFSEEIYYDLPRRL
jgi:hypothetical protein